MRLRWKRWFGLLVAAMLVGGVSTVYLMSRDGAPGRPDAIPGEVMVWHDGGPSEGTGVQVALLPGRKLGAVFLGNSTVLESRFVMPVVVELFEVMFETESGVAKVGERPPEDVAVDPAVLEAVEGGYVAFGRILHVASSGDQLEATIDGTSLDLLPRSENTFGLSHWVHRWGLGRLFELPLDLDSVVVEYQRGAHSSEDQLVVNVGATAFEVAPRYPPLPGGALAWEEVTGVYQRKSRLPDGSIGDEVRGSAEIRLADGRLGMADPVGPVFPLGQDALVILGGPLAGETIVRDPDTGTLAHQGCVYLRSDGPGRR